MILTALGVNGPYPAPGGACSGYLLESDGGETRLLLDCGAGVLGRLLELTPLNGLTAVVISHLHYDHMSDLLPLRYALDFCDRPNLPVMLPQKPAAVRALLDGGRMDLFDIEDRALGEFRLSFLPAFHPVEGYCLCAADDHSRLVYTGDTNIESALELFCHRADLLLADAGLMERDWKARAPHLSARKCGELASGARVERLVLTHLSPRYDPEDLLAEAREGFPRAELARPGARFAL